MYLYALIKFYGHGVERDPKAAVQLFRDAAQRGHADAEFALGVLFFSGDGGPHEVHRSRSKETLLTSARLFFPCRDGAERRSRRRMALVQCEPRPRRRPMDARNVRPR